MSTFFRFSSSIESELAFLSRLKQANITLAFKKGDKNFQENFNPVRILVNVRAYLSSSYSGKFQNPQNLSSGKQQCKI